MVDDGLMIQRTAMERVEQCRGGGGLFLVGRDWREECCQETEK